MTIHRNNLLEIINKAWQRVSDSPAEGSDKQQRNKQRSSEWVSALAKTFREEYKDTEVHRVFWRGNEKNRKQFRINEFLFDVMVCSVSSVESLQRQSNRLEYIDQCHWQVESEFHRSNSREVIVDMSKLVVGSAENKLFIASHRDSGEESLLKLCAGIARRCGGNLYLAFVEHPDRWGDAARQPIVYEWLAGYWEPL